MIKEAATFPLRMEGEVTPSIEDNKENRLYRIPVGVVGVISPLSLFTSVFCSSKFRLLPYIC